MQRKSQGSVEPLSTHTSMQILAKENSLPEVRAYRSVGSDAGEISGVLGGAVSGYSPSNGSICAT